MYNVTTVTALRPVTSPIAPTKAFLELPDDDKAIMKYLANEGYKTFSSKSKELRRELEAHCAKAGLTLVLKKLEVC